MVWAKTAVAVLVGLGVLVGVALASLVMVGRAVLASVGVAAVVLAWAAELPCSWVRAVLTAGDGRSQAAVSPMSRRKKRASLHTLGHIARNCIWNGRVITRFTRNFNQAVRLAVEGHAKIGCVQNVIDSVILKKHDNEVHFHPFLPSNSEDYS